METVLSGNFLWSRSHESFEVGLEADCLVSAQEAGRPRGREHAGQWPSGAGAGDLDFHSVPALVAAAMVNVPCLSAQATSPISQSMATLGASLEVLCRCD